MKNNLLLKILLPIALLFGSLAVQAQCPPGATVLTNVCPAKTVNLYDAWTSNGSWIEDGVIWYTSADRANGTLVAAPFAATGGTYYAFYNDGDCYGPASDPVEVTITACEGDDDPNGTDTSCELFGPYRPNVIKSTLKNTETNWSPADELLFFEDFGASDEDNGDKGRKPSPYLPLIGSFNYGYSFLQGPTTLTSGYEAWDDVPMLRGPRINDNHYAVVAPKNICKGWYYIENGATFDDDWDSWWDINIPDASGDPDGAVMAINAGETLNYFYKRGARVIEGVTYKASFKIWAVQGPIQIAIDIYDVTGDSITSVATPEGRFGEDKTYKSDKWEDIELEFVMPGTDCAARNIIVGFRGDMDWEDGNDYYIDNIQFEKLTEPTCYVQDPCPLYVNLYDAVNDNSENYPGTLLVWKDSNGDLVQFPDMVSEAGTYYASYYDVVNDCYSSASEPVEVVFEECEIETNCVEGCNENTFLNSHDPNTLEYDNIVSTFHSTVVKQSDGTYLIWGQGSDPQDGHTNLLTPLSLTPGLLNDINSAYSGDILKITGGSSGASPQYALLSTTGLYAWGYPGELLDASLTNSYGGLTKVEIGGEADGLPAGVSPADVKMLFGSHKTLAIVTCDGQAWVLSGISQKSGNGHNGNHPTEWTRVSTYENGNLAPLSNVVAVRGTATALMALTANGEVYTWGTRVYLGDGYSYNSDYPNTYYPTKMTLPAGVEPLMIGMTSGSVNSNLAYDFVNTYYLLGKDGKLYALGNNIAYQLGDESISGEATEWVQPQKDGGSHGQGSGDLDNIAWISPNEHDAYNYSVAINVLTRDGKQWSWGNNTGNMIGGPLEDNAYGPIYMPGGLDPNDKLIAVETGGHTTINIKECTANFGYVGHRIYGSMGDGEAGTAMENVYNYTETAKIMVCGAVAAPAIEDELLVCPGGTADLNESLGENIGLPAGVTGLVWWTTPDKQVGTEVADITQAPEGIYYAFYEPQVVNCYSTVVVRAFLPTEDGYENCVPLLYAKDDINQTPMNTAVSGNVLSNDTGVTQVTEVSVDGGTPVVLTGGTATLTLTEGELVINENGSYTFTPAHGYTGAVPPISYTATGANGSTSADLNIKVIPVYDSTKNNPPVAHPDEVEVEKGKPGSGNLLDNDNDPDNDPITVTEITVPGGTSVPIVPGGTTVDIKDPNDSNKKVGELKVNPDGSFTYTPTDPEFTGKIPPIEYKVCDNNGACDISTLDITVTSYPPASTTSAIVANDDTNSAPKGVTMTGDVSTNDKWTGTTPKITDASVTLDGTTTPLAVDGDGNLTATIAGVGTITLDPETGEYTFEPATDFTGTVPVKYTVKNTEGDEDTATLYLTSLPVGPKAENDINQTPMNTAVSGNVLTNDDADLTTVTKISVVGVGEVDVPTSGNATLLIPGKGTIVIDKDGKYTFTPETGYTGPVPTITYTVTNDDESFTTVADLDIKVIPHSDPTKNNPPVAHPDEVIVPNDPLKPGTINIITNDNDPDDDPLIVTKIKIPGEDDPRDVPPTGLIDIPVKDPNDPTKTVGKITITPDGEFTYTPDDPTFTGKIPPIEYTVCDDYGACDTSTVTITVTPTPPVNGSTDIKAKDDSNSAPKGVTMTGDVSENDKWTGTTPKITTVVVSYGGVDYPVTPGTPENIPGVGTVTLNEDGTYTFVPEPDFVGTLPVKYTVENNEGDKDTATLVLTSLPEKPLAKNDINQTPVNVPVSGNVLTNDKGDALTVVAAKYMDSTGAMQDLTPGTATDVYGYDKNGDKVPAGKITLNSNGTYTYTPATNYTGKVPFEYTVQDKYGAEDSAKLNIQVIPVFDPTPTENNPPVANDDHVTLKKYDPENPTPGKGNLLNNDSDPDEGDEITVTKIWVPGNDTAIDVPTGGVFTGDVEVKVPSDPSDPNSPLITIGKIKVNEDGDFEFIPEPGFTGDVPPITYQVCDKPSDSALTSECDTAELNITVVNKGKNSNTTFANDDANSAPVNTPMTGNVLDNDDDPEGHTQKLTSVTIDGVETVLPTDGSDKTITIPGKGTLVINSTGKYTFTPVDGYVGTVVVEQTVCDEPEVGTPVACDNATLTLTSIPSKCVPLAEDDINQTPVNVPVSGNILINDSGTGIYLTRIDVAGQDVVVPNSGVATLTVPDQGTLVIDREGNYTFTPVTGFTGNVGPIRYEVSSYCDMKDEADLNIKVIPKVNPNGENNPPVAHNDNAKTGKDTPVSGNLTGNDNDPDKDPLTVTKINGVDVTGTSTTIDIHEDNDPSKPVIGQLIVKPDGDFTFTPETGFIGDVPPVTYQVCDDPSGRNAALTSECDTAELRIKVVEGYEPPVTSIKANDDTNSAPKGTTMYGDISENDDYTGGTGAVLTTITYIDEDGDPQTLTVTTGTEVTIYDAAGNKAGKLTLDPNGSYEYEPEQNYVGTASVVYTVENNEGDTDKATLYLTTLGSGETRLWHGTIDTDWNKPGNWIPELVPNDGDDIEFATEDNNGPFDPLNPKSGEAKNNLVVPTDKPYTVNNLTNETEEIALEVPPTAVIIVEGKVNGFDNPNRPGKLIIDADETNPNGSFIATNMCGNGDVYGTVILFAQGTAVETGPWNDAVTGSPTFGDPLSSSHSWQHFGVPAEGVVALDAFADSWIQKYDEKQNGNLHTNSGTGAATFYDKWNYVKPYETLNMFEGYEITQDEQTFYTIKGKLYFCDKELTLTREAVAVTGATGTNEHYGLGQNVFGNSYTAAININPDKGLKFNSDEIEKTVYLYRTGSFQDWGSEGVITDGTPNAGSYIAIPVEVGSEVWDNQIPSMQGFLLKYTVGETIFEKVARTVTLEYAKDGVVGNKRPQLAPEAPKSYLTATLQSKTTVDKAWLFSQEGTSDKFDNGWDGFKYYGTPTAFLYSESPDGAMQVNTSDDLDGKVLTIMPNGDTHYTLTLNKTNLEDYSDLHLVDLVARKVIPLTGEETVYNFTADHEGKRVKRFMLVNSRDINFDSFSLLDGYLQGNNQLVMSNLTTKRGKAYLFDMSGRMLLNVDLQTGVNHRTVQLLEGAYILRLEADSQRESVKLIVK